MNKIFLYFVMILITFIVAFCENDFIKLNGYYFIITHMLIGFLLIGRSLMRLLSPISLIYFYTILSLAGGSWGFANGYIILDSLEVGFNSWKQTNFSLFMPGRKL